MAGVQWLCLPLLVALLAASVHAGKAKAEPTTVTMLPDFGELPVPAYTGYLDINATDDSSGEHLEGSLFYFFQPSKPLSHNNGKNDDPLVLWLNGGPGCSSLFGTFLENGMVLMNANGTLVANPSGWPTVANVLYIDAPFGAGFSYAANKSGVVTSGSLYATLVAAGVYEWLDIDTFASFKNNQFHIWGESYGGHYVPVLAARLIVQGKHLKSIGIGNGWIDAALQYQSFTTFAAANHLIDPSQVAKLNQTTKSCLALIAKPQFNTTLADEVCGGILDTIIEANPHRDPTNIERNCSGMSCFVRPEWPHLESYLSRPDVLQVLGVRAESTAAGNFSLCADMSKQFARDYYTGCSNAVSFVLNISATNVIIYNGDVDLVCPYPGDANVADQLLWGGKTLFANAQTYPWQDGTNIAGTYKCAPHLAFVTVAHAGHQVPADQPSAALTLFKTSLGNGWNCQNV